MLNHYGKKLYYKVVNVDASTNKYFSYWTYEVDKGPSDICLEYKIGQWTYPIVPNSKLFVFSSLDAAKTTHGRMFGKTIFRCHVKNPQSIQEVARTDLCSLENNIKRYWSKVIFGARDTDSVRVRCGTIVCDAIKMIEEVK